MVKTIPRILVRNMGNYLSNFRSFRTDNVLARYDDEGYYIVTSYGVEIFRGIPNELETYEFNSDKYSSTTSKLQNAIKQRIL